MRVKTGRKWVDMGPTSPVSFRLPKNVRMPFRSMRLSEYTGNVSKRIDSLTCIIDVVPAYDEAKHPHEDNSLHHGINHILNAHPHAIRSVGEGVLNPERSHLPTPYVPDGVEWVNGKFSVKYRRILIEEVTLPHDCANHLPI